LEPFNNSPEIVCLREQVSRRLTALVSSLQGDFPVRDIPLPANEKVPRTNATSGLSASDCFGIYDPASRCSRTSSAFLALTTDFFSTPYLATWPRCGTLANGKLFQQPMLARPTAESASGCSVSMNWPTAEGFVSYHNGIPHGTKLSDAVKVEPTRNWPTPTQQDAENTAGASQMDRNSLPLNTAVVAYGPLDPVTGPPAPDSRNTDGSRRESWATPTADDANNATRESGAFQSLTRQAGKLNPSWVETLMGYPIGWTQLPAKFVKPKAPRRTTP
jgi:hypothetical protein